MVNAILGNTGQPRHNAGLGPQGCAQGSPPGATGSKVYTDVRRRSCDGTRRLVQKCFAIIKNTFIHSHTKQTCQNAAEAAVAAATAAVAAATFLQFCVVSIRVVGPIVIWLHWINY